MTDPPPLPHRFADTPTVVAVGVGLWLLGAVVLGLAALLGGRPLGIAFATCVAGAVLGVIGFGIFSWQRAAARRGSRTAQQEVE